MENDSMKNFVLVCIFTLSPIFAKDISQNIRESRIPNFIIVKKNVNTNTLIENNKSISKKQSITNINQAHKLNTCFIRNSNNIYLNN